MLYYPIAYFVDEEMEKIEVERCNIDKIGSKYKKFFKDYELDNYYCLSKINYTFIFYTNSLKIQLFPCKNTSENNNHCKSKEIIDNCLNGKNFEINFEDILITPLNYDNPVKERINYVYTTIFKKFGQFLYVEMELVNIETSTNIIGFDFLTTPKLDSFIKYDSVEIIPQPGYDLDDELNNSIAEIEFQLNDKILLEKRNYIQFIDVLGEIGGLMEIIYSFFDFLCSFLSDILYKKTIANNLFTFDIRKKKILIKKGKNLIFKINNDKNREEENRGILIVKQKAIVRNQIKKKLPVKETVIDNKIIDGESGGYFMDKKRITEINSCDCYSDQNNDKESNKNKSGSSLSKSKRNKLNIVKKSEYCENDFIINTIHLKDALIAIFFCYKNKRKNINKILLDETM